MKAESQPVSQSVNAPALRKLQHDEKKEDAEDVGCENLQGAEISLHITKHKV